MQAFQNGPYTGYMAFLITGIIISLLYTWWKFGREYLLPLLGISTFSIAMSLYVSHLFYLWENLPLHVARYYIFKPIGFVPEVFVFSYIMTMTLWILAVSWFDIRLAENLGLSCLIHVISFLPFYSVIILWLITLFLFSLRSLWWKMTGIMLVIGALVVYNKSWMVSSNIKVSIIALEIVAIIVVMLIVYRGEIDEF